MFQPSHLRQHPYQRSNREIQYHQISQVQHHLSSTLADPNILNHDLNPILQTNLIIQRAYTVTNARILQTKYSNFKDKNVSGDFDEIGTNTIRYLIYLLTRKTIPIQWRTFSPSTNYENRQEHSCSANTNQRCLLNISMNLLPNSSIWWVSRGRYNYASSALTSDRLGCT